MPRAVVTGGAGFLGSHLCERLLSEGWDVLCLDSFITGGKENLDDALTNERFTLQEFDVTKEIVVEGDVDWVFHLASPASPIDYLEHPIHTLKVGAIGSLNALGLAKAKGASFFLSSTSEVYGDPLEHPQKESYWGNVNPIGPRGVYDEAKRYAEAMTMAYHRVHGIPVRIVRIFNTFGPRMRRHDGRAVPNFIDQSLQGRPLTVHGDGSQTRSLCYVDDLIEGFWRFANADFTGPVNLGNPREVSVLELAEMISSLAGSDSEVIFQERPVDDPEVRRPDIALAREKLGWEPKISLEDGLRKTIEWARKEWHPSQSS
ncbi:MAG TPA: UDP-glucuronic acid decarboxylase family protein [Actinomycetota bacterium]|nr:UDP-glucuronic acid decarboxylase family protein [Actinomycetota bacterium]